MWFGLCFVLLNADAQFDVISYQKISDTLGNLNATLENSDYFGYTTASLGDLDGDNIDDIAVGAYGDDDGGGMRGSVYILFLNVDGTVKAEQKISDLAGNFSGTLNDLDRFGISVANIGDLDGDNITDIAVGASYDSDAGEPRGAIWILFLNTDGTVKSDQKISATQGNFTGSLLDKYDHFGYSIANIGDLDGDNITDIAVGAYADDDGGTNSGAVWVLFLNTDGTVKSYQKISSISGNFSGTIDASSYFGYAVGGLNDFDGDNIPDLAVGVYADDDGGAGKGAVWMLFLNSDGTVKNSQKISETQGGFTASLDNNDMFGTSVANIGDFDGDGITDIIVGAQGDDDMSMDAGAVYLLFLNANATVKTFSKISQLEGNLNATWNSAALFGSSVTLHSDLNNEGLNEIIVGANRDNDGGYLKGAVWVLYFDTLCDIESNINYSSSTICQGDSLFLSADTINANSLYWWYNENLISSDTNLNIVPHDTGYLNVTLLTENNSCSDSISFQFYVYALPQSDLGNDTIVCIGDTLFLDAGSGFSFNWSDSTASQYAALSINNDTSLYAIISNQYCLKKDTININVEVYPEIYVGSDTMIIYGESITLLANADSNYAWTYDNTLSCSDCLNPIATPIENTTYYFNSYNNFCWSIDSMTVIVSNELGEFEIPNIFTPDNNSFNETFNPLMGQHIDSFEFNIYNRWGVLIYNTNNNEDAWDGTNSNNKICPEGTYYWIISYSVNAKTEALSGYITLLK